MNRAGPFRLAQGGRVERGRTVRFTFNGRPLEGFAGDTLASALLANGIRVVGRSFKLHRPRGIFSAGIEEPNALLRVQIGASAVPMVRATLQPLVEGMTVTSENCFPSVTFDVRRVIDFTYGLWPAGFYNKTFKWPAWHAYEGFVRRTAGIGTLPSGANPAQYFHHNLHCDVLVVGGGIVGLAVALAASRAGVRVVLAERDRELGGYVLGERGFIEGLATRPWLAANIDELMRAPNVRIMRGTLVSGYYDHNVVTAVEDVPAAAGNAGGVERFWRIRAKEIVLATGAIEQPLVFAHNDRPGIMLAGAVRTYLHRFGVAVGREVVIATNNDDAYQSAFDLHDAGVRVAAIVDARVDAASFVMDGVTRRGLTVHRDAMVSDTRGSPAISGVKLSFGIDRGRTEGRTRAWIDCDALGMSSGWNPTVHLYSQAGGKVRYDDALACLVPQGCHQRVHIAGAANGEFDIATPIESGTVVGTEAARASTAGVRSTTPVVTAHRRQTFRIQPLRRTPDGPAFRQWVDFQHDVTAGDIQLAVRENYVSVEHLKRYTTTGMSVDQGKTSNLNALALLSEFSGRPMTEIGTTTFRPQFMPISLGAVAGERHGELYAPVRQLPAHPWHVRNGAQMEDYGGWRRPACYLRNGESRDHAVRREIETVRKRVGLFDGSPLGKIEIRGADAAQFLHRIYINNVISLQPGRVRYGLMLNENGIVIDDGVFARIAPDHFLVSTTAANAERIATWLDEWHQCEWPQLEVVIVPVTTQWAVLTLAGSSAREILQSMSSDIDFSASAFPHMSLRVGHVAGRSARVQRVSFTGELSYEVSVAATQADALWAELVRAGESFGMSPVGVEAWLVLRLEKGFLHVGGDTDGTTNPLDLGFRNMIEKKSGDFVGRRSLSRANDQRPQRRQLVGLEPLVGSDTLLAGAHIVTRSGETRRSEGFITSAAESPTLGRCVALAQLEGGNARTGETVTVFDAGKCIQARVVSSAFYDPNGERMNG
jgi:sarcosine oxidase subunit alpha